MKTINKIRSKDPDIYDAKKEWFKPGDKASGEGANPIKPFAYVSPSNPPPSRVDA